MSYFPGVVHVDVCGVAVKDWHDRWRLQSLLRKVCYFITFAWLSPGALYVCSREEQEWPSFSTEMAATQPNAGDLCCLFVLPSAVGFNRSLFLVVKPCARV